MHLGRNGKVIPIPIGLERECSQVAATTAMASQSLPQLQDSMQTASGEFQKLQNELAGVLEIRQRLDAQLSENELVRKVSGHGRDSQGDHGHHGQVQEFETLTPNNTVYKMIGPVLVPQEQSEAKSNVDKRLEFIRGDM